MTILAAIFILLACCAALCLLSGIQRYGAPGLMTLAAAHWLTLRDALRFRELQRREMRRFRRERLAEYREHWGVEEVRERQRVVEVD